VRISEILGRGDPVFSFEFFPPKTPQGVQNLYRTIEHLRELEPSYVSVTYGAGGSTRELTVDLVSRIRSEIGIEAMAHLTCVGAGRQEIRAVLDELRRRGIENVLALRGDPPRDQPHFVPAPDGFRYASELVTFIREEGYGFCLGGAGYPEGHIECGDLDLDLEHLCIKVNAGLEFVITQLFFDNRDFFAFVGRVRRAGIEVPIIPGIMPITNVSQIERFTRMCGAHIPEELMARLDRARDDEEQVRRIGVEHAIAQCRDLLAGGASGIHFYTLNQSPATQAILRAVRG
jgi:methylenetetrahydrofolate reductase (NADPH)